MGAIQQHYDLVFIAFIVSGDTEQSFQGTIGVFVRKCKGFRQNKSHKEDVLSISVVFHNAASRRSDPVSDYSYW